MQVVDQLLKHLMEQNQLMVTQERCLIRESNLDRQC